MLKKNIKCLVKIFNRLTDYSGCIRGLRKTQVLIGVKKIVIVAAIHSASDQGHRNKGYVLKEGIDANQ